MAPAIPGAESEDLRGFLQVRGDGHGAGNDIEEDVPLRAEEHEEHGGNFKTAAKAKQQEKNDREEGRRGNGGGYLHQGLSEASQARIRTDGYADRNGPERAEDERGIDAQEGKSGALQQLDVVLVVEIGEFASGVKNGQSQSGQKGAGEQVGDPAAQAMLFWTGNSFRGAAGAQSKEQSEPVEEGPKNEAIDSNDEGSAADEMAQSSLRGVGTFHLLKFELIRPSDDGPPDQLIEEDDDRDHGGETPENRASVAAAGGSLQKRSKAGETEIALAED